MDKSARRDTSTNEMNIVGLRFQDDTLPFPRHGVLPWRRSNCAGDRLFRSLRDGECSSQDEAYVYYPYEDKSFASTKARMDRSRGVWIRVETTRAKQ